MATEIRVPTLGESVTEATIGKWFKKAGDSVRADEPLVELETDKVTVEVPAPAAGVLSEITVKEGETVEVGALLGAIGEGNGAAAKPAAAAAPVKSEATGTSQPSQKTSTAQPINAADEEPKERPVEKAEAQTPKAAPADAGLAPSVRRISAESGIDPSNVPGTGRDGRVTKGDMLEALQVPTAKPAQQTRAPSAPEQAQLEERVKMTRLRQTIARRLKDAQNTAAMLTTFNDVDMGAVMDLRAQYKDTFEKKHGVKLGFMGFFVKACVQALKEIPAVNAEIDGDEVVYKNYYNIGVAVGTDRGLVVPIVRNAETMTIAAVEKAIGGLGKKARDGQLGIEDMQGGTFTITNGGVYGSLMSTPILNAPQSGILGMHRIEQRPIAKNGQVVIRPMMYLALSYDHRIVDGQGAVTFLVRVKEALEDPARLILDL
ncbi:2-oxoglutarate dehydrogenase complex dihydrolipoyllysine-residue succinyltransferase [Terrihabitans rhizophilus]|jgi:2-oxoglutarate dehydrogenase E2 component (dihydrolipoamide succinyltransferase)|uniref:Dihydrolipoyllysine-residue succinyltransferase component of 2-oxoglutarate dehydrogenase complex n=1 Tax=Terrihabitans rhizophilus TaxID=3092662 RepID=A0ABU4RQZ8_9HYPH|nr:2-oxoglutarate dehydrogenase complex dihydrolipoyllysine-residue succinyltransferase [Terrihabitans sp. PJ23]MDX6806110.1 2-oxoglutarate dehydrogenase complex dihydrolipoyllysine-residue succinyltransferase [Terrihabitans sp. PJ23]